MENLLIFLMVSGVTLYILVNYNRSNKRCMVFDIICEDIKMKEIQYLKYLQTKSAAYKQHMMIIWAMAVITGLFVNPIISAGVICYYVYLFTKNMSIDIEIKCKVSYLLAHYDIDENYKELIEVMY